MEPFLTNLMNNLKHAVDDKKVMSVQITRDEAMYIYDELQFLNSVDEELDSVFGTADEFVDLED